MIVVRSPLTVSSGFAQASCWAGVALTRPLPSASGMPANPFEVDVVSQSPVCTDGVDDRLLTHLREVVRRQTKVAGDPFCVSRVDSGLSGDHAAEVGVVDPA